MATSRNVGRGGGHSPANVTKHLKGIGFPAKKQDLLKHAKKAGADQEVLQELQGFADQEYNSMADVMKAFGQERKAAGTSKTASKPRSKHA